MVGAAVMVTAASLLLPLFPAFLAGRDLAGHRARRRRRSFAPALAAISLGVVGHRAFTRRIGRNETFNHAGNAVAALIAGAAPPICSGPSWCSLCSPCMSLASLASILAIPEARDRP